MLLRSWHRDRVGKRWRGRGQRNAGGKIVISSRTEAHREKTTGRKEDSGTVRHRQDESGTGGRETEKARGE